MGFCLHDGTDPSKNQTPHATQHAISSLWWGFMSKHKYLHWYFFLLLSWRILPVAFLGVGLNTRHLSPSLDSIWASTHTRTESTLEKSTVIVVIVVNLFNWCTSPLNSAVVSPRPPWKLVLLPWQIKTPQAFAQPTRPHSLLCKEVNSTITRGSSGSKMWDVCLFYKTSLGKE